MRILAQCANANLNLLCIYYGTVTLLKPFGEWWMSCNPILAPFLVISMSGLKQTARAILSTNPIHLGIFSFPSQFGASGNTEIGFFFRTLPSILSCTVAVSVRRWSTTSVWVRLGSKDAKWLFLSGGISHSKGGTS